MATLYRPKTTTYTLPDGSYYTTEGERVTSKTPGAVRVEGRSEYWYGRYKDRNGKPDQVKLAKTKEESRRLLAKYETDAIMGKAGLADKEVFQTILTAPLVDYLEDYRAMLASKRNTPEYVAKTFSQCKAVVEGTGAKRLHDLRGDAVLRFLAGRREVSALAEGELTKDWYTKKELTVILGVGGLNIARMMKRHSLAAKGQGKARRYPRETVLALQQHFGKGASVATCNHYITAIKGFTAWLMSHMREKAGYEEGFNPVNPLAGLKPLAGAEADARVKRRTLGREQFVALVDAAERGVPFRGLTGHARAVLYLLACRTGFRASELAALKTTSFDFGLGLVTIPGKYTKNGDPARLPLRADTATMMQEFVEGKPRNRPLWPGDWCEHGAEMLRGDLAAAGIPYLDDEGQVYDFHALRHQFLTDLASAGVHPKAAQGLARHSTISLTLDRYTHTDALRLRDAVEQLPAILPLTPKTGSAG